MRETVTWRKVTRRAVMLVVILAISGLLIFGGINRTQAVLASESRTGVTPSVDSSGQNSDLDFTRTGHGNRAGLRDGGGNGD